MTASEYHEIGKEFYLIRTPESDLHRNIYLKRFISGNNRVNMLFDPGTKLDTPLLTSVAQELIGGIQNVDLIFLSHQDPDVASNLNIILANAPHAIVVSSMDTLRLIKMLGLPERNLYPIESAGSEILQVTKTGHRVQFIPAYFCHFRGAMMMYDFESNVLFSGDFMAGVNTRKTGGHYADESSFQGVSLFHQIYMPSGQALKSAVDRITMLNPMPDVVAPQHGDIVAGKYVEEFLVRLAGMDVGIEIIQKKKPMKDIVIVALNHFLDHLAETNPQIKEKLLAELGTSGEFTTIMQITNESVVDIKAEFDRVVTYLWNKLAQIVPSETLPAIKTSFVETLDNFGIALPQGVFGHTPPADLLGLG